MNNKMFRVSYVSNNDKFSTIISATTADNAKLYLTYKLGNIKIKSITMFNM